MNQSRLLNVSDFFCCYIPSLPLYLQFLSVKKVLGLVWHMSETHTREKDDNVREASPLITSSMCYYLHCSNLLQGWLQPSWINIIKYNEKELDFYMWRNFLFHIQFNLSCFFHRRVLSHQIGVLWTVKIIILIYLKVLLIFFPMIMTYCAAEKLKDHQENKELCCKYTANHALL